MKLIRNLFIALLPFTFVSCMDTREELEIKKDGSGTLVMKTDLGKMLEMLKGFAPADELQKEGLDKVYDTTTAATLASGNYQLSGVLGSDSVSLNNPANGNYVTANVERNCPKRTIYY